MAFCVCYFFSGIFPGGAEGHLGEKGPGGCGGGGKAVCESESIQSDSGRGLCFAHTGAYNLQHAINHCCVSG